MEKELSYYRYRSLENDQVPTSENYSNHTRGEFIQCSLAVQNVLVNAPTLPLSVLCSTAPPAYVVIRTARLATPTPTDIHIYGNQKRFIYRLLTRHDFLPVWLVANK
jgi:hypothetical protein